MSGAGVQPPQAEPPIHEQQEQEEHAAAAAPTTKPRQWLYDRSNGKSKVQEETLGRPFCPLCFPPPCVKICPDTLEQNMCCEKYGAVGFFSEDDGTSRTWLMTLSMVTHFVGIVFSILSCFSLSKNNAALLRAFSFSSGTATGTVTDSNGGTVNIENVIFRVGLQSVYVQDFFFGERVFPIGEMCTGKTLGIPLTPLQDCNECSDVSSGLIATMILGVVTYIPTIASNVNRMYYNYDINCQKVFGSVITFFNMAMSLYTWKGYTNSCFGSFYDGNAIIPVLVPRGANATSIGNSDTPFFNQNASFWDQYLDPDATTESLTPLDATQLFANYNQTLGGGDTEVRIARVNFDWKPGIGLILIVIATFIKLIDIINHFLLKTPTITRDLQEQLDYEKAYGKQQAKDDENGNE